MSRARDCEQQMAVRILGADDHELIRRGLISLLSAKHPEWEIVGEAATGAAAIELASRLHPTAAILDLSMPDHNGLEVAQCLVSQQPGIRILILTMHAAEPMLQQLRRAGVHAYLAKNDAPDLLVEAMEKMLAGGPFFVSDYVHRATVDAHEYIPAQFLLTLRELEVMRLLAGGKSNKEIAVQLNISVRTAETHHANIYAKLNVDSIGELVRIAVRDHVL